MLRAISCREIRRSNSDHDQYIQSYDEPDLCNDYISMEQGSTDRFSINFPRHYVLGHVLLDTNRLDNVDSWKEVVQPTKKPRSVDPHKLKPMQTLKKKTKNKKRQQRNKKSRSVTIQVPENCKNKNKELRSDNTPVHIKPRGECAPNNPISTISDLHELRNDDEDSTPQRMTNVAGHPENRLHIDSGASLHIIFDKELISELYNTDKPLKIQASDKLFHIKQIESLHQALQYLPLPVFAYHHSETAITNLLLFAKLEDEYYIICNTRIDDAIYVQSKADGNYLRFQRDYKHNLYYMDISEANLDEYCHLNTVKEGNITFSILDQKRAKTVRILQERCGFPSDEYFIRALECNSIEGVDFSRRDVNIANETYGYSKGSAMGTFKHPRKGVKIDRTTEDATVPLPPDIIEDYKDVEPTS